MGKVIAIILAIYILKVIVTDFDELKEKTNERFEKLEEKIKTLDTEKK